MNVSELATRTGTCNNGPGIAWAFISATRVRSRGFSLCAYADAASVCTSNPGPSSFGASFQRNDDSPEYRGLVRSARVSTELDPFPRPSWYRSGSNSNLPWLRATFAASSAYVVGIGSKAITRTPGTDAAVMATLPPFAPAFIITTGAPRSKTSSARRMASKASSSSFSIYTAHRHGMWPHTLPSLRHTHMSHMRAHCMRAHSAFIVPALYKQDHAARDLPSPVAMDQRGVAGLCGTSSHVAGTYTVRTHTSFRKPALCRFPVAKICSPGARLARSLWMAPLPTARARQYVLV